VSTEPKTGAFTFSIGQIMDTISLNFHFDVSGDADAFYDALVSQVLDRKTLSINLVNARIKDVQP
jgi:hypothetical protein